MREAGVGHREGEREMGVGRELVAPSSRQPSLIAMGQEASHLGLLTAEENVPQGSVGTLCPSACISLINF